MIDNNTQPLFAEERKNHIVELINENRKITVPELCEYFKVSPATIRNDLRDLSNEGKIKRTHGGAVSMGKINFELTSKEKDIANLEEKKKIASYAASLVEDGDTIAMDTGTTLYEFAKCLVSKKNLTILSNDIRIAAYLEANTDANIIVLGGVLRKGFQCTVGPMAINSLSNLNVDKAFIATNAFSPSRGFTTPDLNQAEVKKAMMKTASEIIVLCDSSKIGKVSFVEFATIEDIDMLITDNKLTSKMKNYLQELKESIEVYTV